MALSDGTTFAPLLRAQVVGLAPPWPKPSAALTLELVEAMHVLSLRHLPGGGTAALSGVMSAHRLPALPEPGRCCGIDPLLVWRSPTEILLLTQDPARVAALLSALRPAPGVESCAHDLSPGSLVVRAQGTSVDSILVRVLDAQAWPRNVGGAARSRLADIAAVIWRAAPDRVGILVDRANDQYLRRWLSYTAEAS